MAEIQPLQALYFDSRVAGPLEDLLSPPYDVIDAPRRAALAARSPFNAVEVDLPEGDDPYGHAASLFEAWMMQGVIAADRQPCLWALSQDYTGPDGRSRTRRGFFARLRVEEYGAGRIRPHERTHPGPKEDRLRLTRAVRANLSPIFVLYSDPTGSAWNALEPQGLPWTDVLDPDGVRNRLWRISDEQAIDRTREALSTHELLIADGHHRYETARVYAEEIGGEGPHRYVLACLVALEDPGLAVFPTHRLVRGLDGDAWERLDAAITRDFDVAPVSREELAPPPGTGPLQLGYIDVRSRTPLRITLKDQAIADAALRAHSEPYRHLDTGILETVLLRNTLSLSDDDISHLRNFGYARDATQALAAIEDGEYEVAFLMRPPPVHQVGEIAAAGENMPPKSTYFYPKLPTGLLFNPLA